MRRFSAPEHPGSVTSKVPPPIDPSLICRAQRGDLRAMEMLYLELESTIYTLALKLCRTPADAEDILQETFIELSRNLKQFRSQGSFTGWVKRICTTKALMRLRRSNRLQPLDEIAAIETEPADPGVEPHLRIDLEMALDLLGDTSRVVVWLHDVEGYTHEEIAEVMDGTPSFSKSQLSRAHAQLRKWLIPTREAACNT